MKPLFAKWQKTFTTTFYYLMLTPQSFGDGNFVKKITTMKITLKLEELAMTAIAIYFLSIYNLGIPFWW